MKYINTFNSMTDFNEDKRTNLNQPRVALVKENGGGVDKLFYIKFKIYEYGSTSYLNGMSGNEISEDIPVKTTVRDIYNDETMKRIYSYMGTDYLGDILVMYVSYLTNLTPYLTVTPDSLDLIEDGRLVTKFTLTGLKRKDSDQRDFVGEIACYMDESNQPILFKVDRSNPDHPTVSCIFGSLPELSTYMENHEVEKRIKSVILNKDHL